MFFRVPRICGSCFDTPSVCGRYVFELLTKVAPVYVILLVVGDNWPIRYFRDIGASMLYTSTLLIPVHNFRGMRVGLSEGVEHQSWRFVSQGARGHEPTNADYHHNYPDNTAMYLVYTE